MGDRSADIHIWNFTDENRTSSEALTLKTGVTSYKGAIISNNAGYADQFATTDDVNIAGVQFSIETVGDGVKKIKVKNKFTLKNVYLDSVADTDVRKPVWASGATICYTSGGTNDLSLTYSEGAKLFGFVRKYRSSGKADIYVDPQPLHLTTLNLGHIAFGELAATASPFIGDFGQDYILKELQSVPRFALATADKEANCILKNGTDAVTGTLQVIDSGYTLGTAVVQALTGDYLYLTAGVDLTLYVATVGGSGNPDAGECDITVEAYEVPACGDF